MSDQFSETVKGEFEQFLDDYKLTHSDPAIMGGEPVIIGTRVLRSQLVSAHQAEVEQAVRKARWKDYLFMADALMDKRISADDALQEWKKTLKADKD